MNEYWSTIRESILFGEDITFWVAILVGGSIKWLFSEDRKSMRVFLSGFVTGAAFAYYGHDAVIRYFETLTEEDTEVVVIAMVFVGEHVMRIIMKYLPNLIEKRLGIEKEDRDVE
jgi:hypothetical protein